MPSNIQPSRAARRARFRPRDEMAAAVIVSPSERDCFRRDGCYIAGLACDSQPILIEAAMRRAPLFAIATLPLWCGCRSLERDVVAIEYHPGSSPATGVTHCNATYRLTSPEPNVGLEYATIELPKGSTVGFRRQLDGTMVAVAGDKTTPITDCHSVWRYTPKPTCRWDRLLVDSRYRCERAAGAAWDYFLLPYMIVAGCVTGEWP